MVEMKPVYLGLKGNQGTMVTYVSICFSMMELMCDDWFIGLYIIIMVEMKQVYQRLKGNQGTMVTYNYMLQYDWIDVVSVIIEL